MSERSYSDIVERLTDVVMMLDAPDAYNREYIAAVCRSILRSASLQPATPTCHGPDDAFCMICNPPMPYPERDVAGDVQAARASEPSHVMCVGWPTIKRLAAGEAVWFESLECGAVAADDLHGADIDAMLGNAQSSLTVGVLHDIFITMRHARTFIASREKMHPAGIELWDKLFAQIEALQASSLSSTDRGGK